MSDAGVAIDMMAIPFQIGRRVAGTYDAGGNFVSGTEALTSVVGVIQPASGRQLMDVEEGLRAEARWIAWSRSELRLDDRIIYGSISYRVMVVWPRAEGVFYKAALGLLKNA